MGKDNLITCIGEVIPSNDLIKDDDQLAGFCQSWRGEYKGRALAMVYPRSTEQLQQLVLLCAKKKIAIVPQGGNTGLTGGAQPDSSGAQLLVNMARMNRIIDTDTDNNTLTLEAGCLLATVQEHALEHDRLFPLRLASEQSCQIGGNIATNAGGSQVLSYGNMRELTLGLEAVMPDGSCYNALRSLRKNNAGYDLKHLLIGSEGTLGLITKAVVKLFPRPVSEHTAWVCVSDVALALSVLKATQSGCEITTCELISGYAADLVAKHISGTRAVSKSNWHLLLVAASRSSVEFVDSDFAVVLQDLMEKGVIDDAWIAASQTEAAQMWKIRESIPLAQNQAGYGIKHDISLPISSIPEFILDVSATLEQRFKALCCCVFGHMGDGNLHYNMVVDSALTKPEFDALKIKVNEFVHGQVIAHKGSISAEHGIGIARKKALASMLSQTELALLSCIKSALDPQALFNPGKVVDVSTQKLNIAQ